MIPEILQPLIFERGARYASFSFSTDTFTIPVQSGVVVYPYALDIQLNPDIEWAENGISRIGANINADTNRINRAWLVPRTITDETAVSQSAFYCWEFMLKATEQGIAINIGYIVDGEFGTGIAQAPELVRPLGYRDLPAIARSEELDPINTDQSYWANSNQIRVPSRDMNNLDIIQPINIISGEIGAPPFVATIHCVISNLGT